MSGTLSDSSASAPNSTKKKKGLDVQRAFRARKAAHLADLETKTAIYELDNARLKRENTALKLQNEELKRALEIATARDRCGQGGDMLPIISTAVHHGTSSTSDARLSYENRRLDANLMPGMHSTRAHASTLMQANPQASLAIPNHLPLQQSFPFHKQEFSHFKASSARLSPLPRQIQEVPSYSTSLLPVSSTSPSISMMSSVSRSVTPLVVSQVHSRSHPVVTNYEQQEVSVPVPIVPTAPNSPVAIDCEHHLHQLPIPMHTLHTVTPSSSAAPVAAQIKVTCCNGLFRCEEENEAQWVRSHTGPQGIGSNTIDDFYALFGDNGGAAPSSSTTQNNRHLENSEQSNGGTTVS